MSYAQATHTPPKDNVVSSSKETLERPLHPSDGGMLFYKRSGGLPQKSGEMVHLPVLLKARFRAVIVQLRGETGFNSGGQKP